MSRAPLIIAALVLLAAWPAMAADDGQPRVLAIRAEGLQRIPFSTLVQRLRTREGEPLAPFRLSEDIKALYRTGWFEDVRVFALEEEQGVVLTFRVKELPRVQKVAFRGHDEIDEDDLSKAVTVKAARFLNLDEVERSISAVRALYRDKGYYLAEIRYTLEYLPQNRVDLFFDITENEKVRVTRIRITGNREVTDEDITRFMQTGEANYFSFLSPHTDSFKEDVFDLDLRRVQWVYLTKGFLDVKLGQPVVDLAPNMREVGLTIPVEEGPRYTVGKVIVTSMDPDGLLFTGEELAKDLVLKEGEVFNMENVQQDSDRLGTRYMDVGFANANVGSRNHTDRERRIVDFTYVVQKGNPTFVRNIEVTGNATTRDKVIRRELKIAEGDLFSQSLLDRSEASIMRLGFFKEAKITRKPVERGKVPLEVPDADFVDLLITVEEQDTGALQVGAGFSSLESFIFQGRLSKNNFLGRGQTFSIQAMISSLRQIYMFSFMEPCFFDTDWTFSFDLYNMQTVFEEFSTDSLGGNVSFGYRFLEDYLAYGTYKLENKTTDLGGRTGFSTVPIERYKLDGLTSSLQLSFAWDTRNNRLVPTKGWYNSVSYEWASPWLGSDTDYHRVMLNSRWYIPLWWDLILRLNGTLGWVSPTAPLFERFFVGGIF
ncbi:MAG: outer membrane protein assembly factor BamA, partial [Deltaproteobacteria bacterium]|nr:outer membrane protein assembly factor BamA [Deltaproteobacteria bacterium]